MVSNSHFLPLRPHTCPPWAPTPRTGTWVSLMLPGVPEQPLPYSPITALPWSARPPGGWSPPSPPGTRAAWSTAQPEGGPASVPQHSREAGRGQGASGHPTGGPRGASSGKPLGGRQGWADTTGQQARGRRPQTRWPLRCWARRVSAPQDQEAPASLLCTIRCSCGKLKAA